MGMSILAYTAHPRPTPASKCDRGFIVPGTGDPDGTLPLAWYSGLDKSSLHTFLAQDIDILLVSVPLTTSTTHLLGKEEFEILARRNAFVSNISRGQILVQEELVEALRVFEEGGREGVGEGEGKKGKRGGLRGAALDVTDPEPLPRENELWGAPNCIVTPHVSGLGREYADRAFQVLVSFFPLFSLLFSSFFFFAFGRRGIGDLVPALRASCVCCLFAGERKANAGFAWC